MTRPRLDPDPLYVEPEPVRRLEPDEDSGMVIVYLFAAILGGLLIALVLSVWLAASRSAPDPGPSQASLTGQGRTGAPQPDVSALGRPPAPGVGAPPIGSVNAELVTPPEASKGPPAATLYRGTATWYCGHGSRCPKGYGPDDLVAAIDRKDSPFRKGDRVEVRYSCGKGCLRAVAVTIVDVCACGGVRLIDLTTGAFQRLAPLGLGVIPVTIVPAAAAPTLPPTDEETR